MAKSFDTLLETETIIRFDETGEPATLWTASPKVKKLWESYGFPVVIGPTLGTWFCLVPIDRIGYKVFRNGTEKAAAR